MVETTRKLIALVKENGLTVATAESCTGGKIAAELVSVSGASEVFFEGVVTYANEAKIRRLGVKEETLKTVGAVSAETAAEMAEGLLKHPVTVGISTTGIAGPGGGSEEKPVGLVFIGIAAFGAVSVTENRFTGNREEIREKAKDTAIQNALNFIKYRLRSKQ